MVEMVRLADNMQRQTRFLHGYLLITSGRRHVPDVTKQPAALAQMRPLELLAKKGNASLEIVAWDYARKGFRSLAALGSLFEVLENKGTSFEKGQPRGYVWLASYSKLFHAAADELKTELWTALIDYEDHIRDVQTTKSLTELSPEMALLVKTGSMPPLKDGREPDMRAEVERKAQTESAREFSKLVRKQRAKRAARELKEAFDAYKDDTPGASLKTFIDSDASKGLLNSHGKPWAYSSAQRVLREMKNDDT